MRELIELFGTFVRIGGLTFGGGYAMLPMLEKEAIEKKQWVSREELLDYYAVAQCTPGIIAGNTAALVGYRVAGPAGGAAALGVVTPSYGIITMVAAFMSEAMGAPWVRHGLAGVQACVAALILSSLGKLWKKSVCDRTTRLFFLAAALAALALEWPPAVIVAAASLGGIAAEAGKKRAAP